MYICIHLLHGFDNGIPEIKKYPGVFLQLQQKEIISVNMYSMTHSNDDLLYVNSDEVSLELQLNETISVIHIYILCNAQCAKEVSTLIRESSY